MAKVGLHVLPMEPNDELVLMEQWQSMVMTFIERQDCFEE